MTKLELRESKGLLQVDSVSREFGGIRAVQNLTFSMTQGELVGLIGPNGSGKTTVINLISGIYSTSSGQILLDGRSLQSKKRSDLVTLGITRTFQTPRLFDDLSVIQHVLVSIRSELPVQGSIWKAVAERWRDKIDEASEFLATVGLLSDAEMPASALAYGSRRRLEIARCLASRPRFILLDEPTAGLTYQETDELKGILQGIALERNCGLLVVEHKMNFLRGLCSRMLAMNRGELIAEGLVDDVLANPTVLSAYLGRE